jgi:curved DNA-binding protein CbpA
MSTDPPDPYVVLGVNPSAGSAEITAAYRRAVRACHPDTPHPDRDRLAAVITAYRHLCDQRDNQDAHPLAGHHQRSARATDIPSASTTAAPHHPTRTCGPGPSATTHLNTEHLSGTGAASPSKRNTMILSPGCRTA